MPRSRLEASNFGNPVVRFTLQEPHKQLELSASHETEVLKLPKVEAPLTPAWETVPPKLQHADNAALLDAYQFTFDSPYIERSSALADYAKPSFPFGRPILDSVLTSRIHADFVYDPKATTLSTTLAEVLSVRRGVCQDFAHLQIGCLRSLGLAARYISGYLLTKPALGKPRLVGADASHAWLAVYIPGFDWVPIDPTNDLMPSDQHILLAWGRDYDDVSPIKGVIFGGGKHTVRVSVDVQPA